MVEDLLSAVAGYEAKYIRLLRRRKSHPVTSTVSAATGEWAIKNDWRNDSFFLGADLVTTCG